MLIIFISLLVNLVLSYLVSIEGSKREIGGLKSFFISFVFSPLFGLLFVAISRRLNPDEVSTKLNVIYVRAIAILIGLIFGIYYFQAGETVRVNSEILKLSEESSSYNDSIINIKN